jgi:hypothetical protein
VIARAAVMLTVALCLAGCIDPCDNDILNETISPDRQRRVVIFERSCGATTGFSTHLSVLSVGENLPRAAGNTFIADSNRGAANPMFVRTRWQSPDRLVITFPERARVYLREVRIGSLNIIYESAPN